MKYLRLFFLGCLIWLLCFTPTVMARAGGGSSGSGSSSSTHHSSTHSQAESVHPAVTTVTTITVIGGFAYLSYYTKVYQIKKVRKKYHPIIKSLKKSLPYDMDGAVIDLYYTVQNAWKNQDMVILFKHLDTELANQWQTKLEWMAFRHERNVMEQIHLINIYPFAVVNDHVFYCIHGIMSDYIEDTDTQKMISGTKIPQPFIEFWEIELSQEHLKLCRIYQTDELSASDFNE